MNSSIFSQLWNNRRNNGWMALELLLVFCFIWYLIDFFFVLGFNYTMKNYRDINYTWKINLSTYSPEHPSYQADRDNTEMMFEDYNRILTVLRNASAINAVGISFNSSTPGSTGYSSNSIINPEDSSRVNVHLLQFCPESDFIDVFRHTKENGSISASVKGYDWSLPDGVLINQLTEQILYQDGSSAKGKELTNNNGDKKYLVLGVLDNTKRFNSYRPEAVMFIPLRLNKDNYKNAEISIQAKSNQSENQFKTDFIANTADRLQIGNYYFRNMTSYSKTHEDTEKMYGLTTHISTRICMMLFFLLNIVLCLIGTFWYRVSRRKEEIGIRIALGSSRLGIRQLFITEAFYLLIIILPFALLLEYQIVHFDLLGTYGEGTYVDTYIIHRPLLRFAITNFITFFFLCVVLISAVWLPAQKATTIEPAEALHDE